MFCANGDIPADVGDDTPKSRAFPSGYRRVCSNFFLAMVACFLLAIPPSSAQEAAMRLDVGKQVIRCEAGPVGDPRKLEKMLRQGASITVTWEFTIARVHRYWLNDDAGKVVVTRVVSSDLISRRWRLRDETAGVATDTSDPNRAVRFLSYLDSFPLIDRALLEPGATYEVSVKLHLRDSDQPLAWWQRWVDFGKTVLTRRFTLPVGK